VRYDDGMPIQDQPEPLVAEAQRVLTSPVERELFCVAYHPDWLSDLPDAPLSDATWNTQLANLSSADAQRLREQLIRWQQLRNGTLQHPATTAAKPQPPAPSIPLRLLQPDAQYHPDLHVSSPDLEQRILYALREGVSVNLLGGTEQGKSWWIQHILRTLQKQHPDIKTLYVDLSRWSTEVPESRPSLFRKLREELLHQLRLTTSELHGIPTNPESFDEVWPLLAAYHQRPECRAQQLVLALDGTNALLDSPTVDAFFGPLRSLMQDTAYVSLLVSLSAPPVSVIRNVRQSRLSWGETHVIPDFRLDQLAALSEKYGRALGKDDEQRLWKLLCGQPYLVRWALYRACRETSRPLSTLLEEAACLPDGGTLFHDYFGGLRAHLTREQLDTLGKVYTQAGRGCPEEDLRRLTIQGLIVPQQRGGHRLHCRLFLHLLRQ
jgi:hypothetical protein